MIFQLENAHLKIAVKSAGAELSSLFHKKSKTEYLWQGDPKFWNRQAPVLFPFVGKLKNDTYLYQGKQYHLPQHGFARNQEFELEHSDENKIILRLNDSAETRKVYPFAFQLEISYELRENALITTYYVENKDSKKLYFSIGGHPAFRVPWSKTESFEDYELLFDKPENAPRYLIKHGLLSGKEEQVFSQGSLLPLTEALFTNDALVFKGLNSEKITLRTPLSKHSLSFIFPDFPYFGIWKNPGAAYVCLEPWCGIADSVDSGQRLEEKEGIISLEPGNEFSRYYSVIID